MPTKEKPVSPAEQRVLDILWKKSPQSAMEIIDKLAKTERWQNKTIKTLITRLVKKRYLGFMQEKNYYLYFPLLNQEEYQQSVCKKLIHRVFGGRISPLVAYFAKEEKISKEDIKELKSILKDLDRHEK